MFTHRAPQLLLGLALSTLSGCVAVSRTDGVRSVDRQLHSADESAPHVGDTSGTAASDARVAELLAAPLTASAAVQVAFLRNPQVLEAYARLGLSQADVVAASRIANLVISGSIITGEGERQAIGGIGQSLTELLMLSARKRLAAGEYERTQQLIAASLLDLIRDTEADWYRYVTAEQVSAMRAAVARAAEVSATLAQRFFDAGNVSELDLTLKRANAAQARLAALRAATDARAAKYRLQQQMGLSGTPQWRAVADLPAPVSVAHTAEALVNRAHEHRADLLAARQEVTLLEGASSLARRWRWLGNAEVGVQRERETDGRVLTGPTLALALPIFNQGQAGIARAEAQLEVSRARLQALEAAADNAVRLGVERLEAAHQVAEEYRQSLVPEHEVIVKRQQELQNFMIVGQFELLRSKQQQYDAYQGYLEAVRDCWLARVELVRAVGAELPEGAASESAPVGVDSILHPTPEPMGPMEHGHHGSSLTAPSLAPGDTEMPDMPGMEKPAHEPPPNAPK